MTPCESRPADLNDTTKTASLGWRLIPVATRWGLFLARILRRLRKCAQRPQPFFMDGACHGGHPIELPGDMPARIIPTVIRAI
jgi:hypothetical protein